MAKRIRILVTAVATILICVALIAVGSYALFSDTTRVTNHLQAGDLDIRLWRTDLSGMGMNNEGYVSNIREEKDVEFTGANTDNIFDVNNKKIAPGVKYTAEMILTRSETTNVAVGYWLDFIVPFVTEDNDEALLEQLKITVEYKTITDTDYKVIPEANGKMLSEFGTVTSDNKGTHFPIGSVDKLIDTVGINESFTDLTNVETAVSTGEAIIAKFKVTVEFINDPNIYLDPDGNLVDNDANINNLAKDGKVSFDIVVNAVQVVIKN